MGEMLTAFLMLAAGHYLADYALQNNFVARMKGQQSADGFHTLVAHASIHGLVLGFLAVYLGAPWLPVFLFVTVTHGVIDFGKARLGWYGLHVDQALHMTVILITILTQWGDR